MEGTTILKKSYEYVKGYFDRQDQDNFPYHNWNHTLRVLDAVKKLISADASIDDRSALQLQIAALFHDIGYFTDCKNHEQVSADKAAEFLSSYSFPEEDIQEIQQLILATKPEWKAGKKNQYILRDADMSGLASKDYMTIVEGLRQEKNYGRNHKEIAKEKWIKENIKFLSAYKYESEVGRQLFNKGRKKNIKKLKKKKKAMKKESRVQTIASSKSAQTQLKTALRNHIDLSAIADNKSNMMLSINAMILTIGLPLLINITSQYPKMVFPILLLSLISIISMIFATLATRPISMSGLTNLSDIPQKKSNLFFFGNFYKMKFDDFNIGIKEVIADDEILDNSITRDLFFLGKALGKKYDHLRLCYNIFMYGLAITMILAAVLIII